MAENEKLRPVLAIINGDGEAVPPVPPSSGDREPPDLRPVEFSDDALATALSGHLGQDWLYDPATGSWYHFTGQRWVLEKTSLVFWLSRKTCRAVASNIDNKRIARQVSSKSTIYAAAKLAGEDRRHATSMDAFDTNPWLLNTPSIVVDLRSGARLAHAREQMITHCTAVAPEGEAPHFHEFLHQVTQGNREMQAYLKRVAGYCHTGSVEEHALFFIYGPTRNGKTTFVEMMAASVGDYACAASMDLFTIAKGERHPEELAILAGKRLVTATETTKGKPWDSARLKLLTGGDRVRARFMRTNSFEFAPTWKLLFAGNYRPPMRYLDAALKARMHLIPFRLPTIPEERRDKKLREKLIAELGGILKWAIEGAAEWREKGLAPPAAVVRATEEYFKSEDLLGRWISERCVEGVEHEGMTGLLYRDYKSWAAATGEYAMSAKQLSEDLVDRGYIKTLHSRTRQSMFRGLKPLLSPEELPLEPAKSGMAAKKHDPAGAEAWRHDPGDDWER